MLRKPEWAQSGPDPTGDGSDANTSSNKSCPFSSSLVGRHVLLQHALCSTNVSLVDLQTSETIPMEGLMSLVVTCMVHQRP